MTGSLVEVTVLELEKAVSGHLVGGRVTGLGRAI